MIKSVIGATLGLLFILLTTGCNRAETSAMAIQVPAMESERDSRIVTNAALDEVVGSLGSIKHEYEFDLNQHVLIYHESQRLASAEYRSQLIQSLEAVGLNARIEQAAFNPLPPLLLPDNEVLNSWPDRFSARISIPELDTIQEANIVADALAFIRNGGDDPRVAPDPRNRKLTIAYNNVALSQKNIEEAIACTGYTANGVPPKNVSNGWNRSMLNP